MAKWLNHSVLIALQSAFGTENTTDGDFKALYLSEPASWAPEIETTQTDGLSGQVGTAPKTIIGRRSGKLTLKMYLEAFKTGYSPTTENPGGAPASGAEVVPLWFPMVGAALGSYGAGATTMADFIRGGHLSCSQYTANGVASATAAAVTLDNSTASDKVSCGELLVTALSPTSTVPQVGFVKTKAGQVCTLFENSVNTVDSASGHCYGTATAWVSNSQYTPKALTIRLVGQETEFCQVLTDCVMVGWTRSWDSGDVPMLEMTFNTYDYYWDKTKGGLVTPDSYVRVPRLVGTNSARATINGSAQCGVRSAKLTWVTEIREETCHGASQKIESVSIRRSWIEGQFSLAYDSADLVYDDAGSSGNTGQHKWRSWFERGQTISLGCYVGAQVGRTWAFLLPACDITAVSAGDIEGAWGENITVRSAPYSGDSTDTAETAANSPLNSPYRESLG